MQCIQLSALNSTSHCGVAYSVDDVVRELDLKVKLYPLFK